MFASIGFPPMARVKSGGARVIYFFHGFAMPIYLLAAYAKNEKATLTEREKAMMKVLVKGLVASAMRTKPATGESRRNRERH